MAHPSARGAVGTLTVAVEPDPSRHAPEGVASGAARVDGSPAGRVGRRIDYLVCAVVAFVPMLWSQPGTVTDDTKTYLYLDPGRYVREALSLWNPDVALGTVTHENIGYLLPMGPFYWLMAELHVPIWVAQRLWLGSLLFAAGAGMLYLCRTIGLTGPGRAVATLAFMFTPYVLQYSGRISVILMPWSGLPWMIAFVVLALRRGGWRYPALFALVVALVSGINASSILYVGIGPVLWIPFAVVVLRQNTWREAWGVVWKVGLLTALVSLWWAVGLQVEAAYGVNILKYTETLESTSTTSTPAEVIRGLGYWFFYGASDQTGPWTQASVAYTQQLWLLGLTFLVPAMAVLAAAVVRWRHRAYFVFLVLIGTVLAVGPYPYESPTGVSGLIKAFMLDTTAGLALRSTDRASPLVILGLAVLLGAGTTAVARRMTRLRWLLAGFVLAVITLAAAPLWTGATVVNGLTQPAVPPPYVLRAVHHLNTTHPGTRVYGLPGNNFAAYRWGDTIDTVYPALLDRPFVTHEQQTMGSLPTADLLEAVDTPLQEGTFDPSTLAPMMSLMSVGDVLVQYDLRYEMYDTPDPRRLALDFAVTPPGLSDPVAFGAPRPNVSTRAERGRVGAGPARPRRPEGTPGDLHRRPPPADGARRVPHDAPGGGRQQLGTGQRLVGGAPVGEPDHLLLGIAGHPGGAARPGPVRQAEPGGHRHQPQAGVPVERHHPQLRLHQDGVGGPGPLGPVRLTPRPLPRGAGRRPEHHRVQRDLLGDRVELRVAGASTSTTSDRPPRSTETRPPPGRPRRPPTGSGGRSGSPRRGSPTR